MTTTVPLQLLYLTYKRRNISRHRTRHITPFVFRSWDSHFSTLRLPLEFAGTYLTNGLPANASACVTGLDQASFVMGTGSSSPTYVMSLSRKISSLDLTYCCRPS
ncbi:uncharacterized protein BJ212DRAFT_348070 [Suillus subaureus]|uniref:Lysophospholipase n=1 Tax=Suillus subaureus TaxID=48587 RepID=A0A9P7JC94_9AGAM|nr:uncharacterized protein BJ212DRAFT_348070 [Suillus subaureus]KAG1814700.1 hypothetical protein BJ212DRAFT_348070 [Suillus subaureus]